MLIADHKYKFIIPKFALRRPHNKTNWMYYEGGFSSIILLFGAPTFMQETEVLRVRKDLQTIFILLPWNYPMPAILVSKHSFPCAILFYSVQSYTTLIVFVRLHMWIISLILVSYIWYKFYSCSHQAGCTLLYTFNSEFHVYL